MAWNVQSVLGRNKCMCSSSFMCYVMDACDRVQSIIILPPMVGTSFMLVALTRLNVSDLKAELQWEYWSGEKCIM